MNKQELIKVEPGGSPDYLHERTGRCRKCKARFIWPAKLGKTKDTYCPFCGSQLQQTTYQWKGDTYRVILPGTRIRLSSHFLNYPAGTEGTVENILSVHPGELLVILESDVRLIMITHVDKFEIIY